MTTVIEISRLTKRFGNHSAVQDLSLQVPRGSVTGFIGPNGAGKTTAIRMMLGLARPTSGRIVIDGVTISLNPPPELLARVAYLPEEPAFPDAITAAEFVSLVLRLHGGSAGREQIRRHLDAFGLADAADRRAARMSRGMRQRLGLAAVTSTRPDIIILDEPVSALDPAGRREVLDMIRRARHSATVFMSSHILADVERVCDHIAVITGGRLRFWGTLAECLGRDLERGMLLRVARGDEDAAVAALRTMGSAAGVNRLDDDRIIVHPVEGRENELEAGVAARVVGAGVNLIELVPRRPDLERAFFAITGTGEGGMKP